MQVDSEQVAGALNRIQYKKVLFELSELDNDIGVGTVGAPGACAPPTLPGIYIYGECKGS